MLSGRTLRAFSLLPLLLIMLSIPFASASEAADKLPLRIGVGGDYPDGLDGVLNDRGLPHERVFPWELADPRVLGRYQVLLLSCPVATRGSLNEALRSWLQGGGRLYIETWAGMQGVYPLPELVDTRGTVALQTDVLLAEVDHPVLRGLSRSQSIDVFHLQGTFLHPRQPGATVLANFCPDGGGNALSGGTAIFSQPIDKGEVVYSGAPLSFCVFHRAPTTVPLLMSIVDHLAQGRALPRLTITGDAAAAAGGLPAPLTPRKAAAPGKPPLGLRVIEEAAEGAYNVSFMAAAPAGARGADTPILLDAAFGADRKPKRPLLWLTLGRERVALTAGKTSTGKTPASAVWPPWTQAQGIALEPPQGIKTVGGGGRGQPVNMQATLPSQNVLQCEPLW